MYINYVEDSNLLRLIKADKVEAISTVSCNSQEFEELYKEAVSYNLLDKSDEDWFTVKSVNFSIHKVSG